MKIKAKQLGMVCCLILAMSGHARSGFFDSSPSVADVSLAIQDAMDDLFNRALQSAFISVTGIQRINFKGYVVPKNIQIGNKIERNDGSWLVNACFEEIIEKTISEFPATQRQAMKMVVDDYPKGHNMGIRPCMNLLMQKGTNGWSLLDYKVL